MVGDDVGLSIAYGGPLPPAPAEGAGVGDWLRHWTSRGTGVAVEDGLRRLTYAELDALADRTADALRDRVRPGDVVGVRLERSVELVATALAVVRLGAVYLPLGPNFGAQRLDLVRRTVRVACVVAAADAGGTDPDRIPLPAAPGPDARATVAAFTPVPSEAAPVPADTGYVVLTSGTSGTPRAIAVGQDALAALVRWYHHHAGLGPGEKHSLLINPAFDPHVMELFATLCSGATLAVTPGEACWDPYLLTSWWARAEVTVSNLPTPIADLVLARPWPADLRLRHLGIGGERLRRWPGPDVTATVHNMYGPAEATVTSVVCRLSGRADQADPPPIGAPVAGAVVCVTNAAGRTVARGEPGELRIGGSGLSLACFGDRGGAPFVAPPPELADLDRVYPTGDRVRMGSDGVLEFLGRVDDQVKVSGVRVEPAEVEVALERDPGVARAAVVATSSPAGLRLTAFVQPRPGCRIDADEVLSGVRGWLPEQAVPAVLRVVDPMPVTANGKTDRAALADLVSTPAGSPQDTEGLTEQQRLVLAVCRDLLDRPETTLDDHFAEIGGNSLMAARLLAALENATGTRLRASALLRQPDLAGIAALLDGVPVAASRPTRDG
ncbi:amino acid adenylation domain-containing protein [Micromonospora pallida]|uniref:Amino acid adenylation domain-containing protein n=2 Tax=Micromonospora pallida TaxID=145854 RepID=A0A1C6S9I0_9ACTN|nr:amino acid adenylation domain-containing protein [Micromonospora pallida]